MSDNGDRNAKRNEEELESKQLNILYKRYYVDVKQNARGRFLKIAEMGSNYKSRLILSMAAAVQLRDQLTEMIKFSDSVPEGGDNAAENGALKSETLVFDSRRYYLDLKENARGRYLRIAQTISNPRATRSQVAIPSVGIAEVRDAITDLLDKYSEGYLTETSSIDLPKSKQVSAENNKVFYFDVGNNDRGTYVRVTEVKTVSGFRTSITIPASALEKFRESFDSVIEEIAASEHVAEAEAEPEDK